MKRYIFLILYCILFHAFVSSQTPRQSVFPRNTTSILDNGFTSWQWLNPLPQGNSLWGVHAIDTLNIFAVGDLGTILKSTDGGKTWTVKTKVNGINSGLYSVRFTDNNTGTAVGGRLEGLLTSHCNILRTTNSGETWVSQVAPLRTPLFGVDFIDANNGIAVGYEILRTTNGGTTWSRVKGPTGSAFLGIDFINDTTAMAVGDHAQIYRTTDAGVSWNQQISGASSQLRSVSFVTKDFGIAVGTGGTILRTTDGGISWIQTNIGVSTDFWGVSFTDVMNGVIVGMQYAGNAIGIVLRTTDGGITWNTRLKDQIDIRALQSVSLVDTIFGIAVGGDWYGYGTGTATILETHDGGQNWSSLVQGVVHPLLSITFKNPNNGIAVGAFGTVMRTSDGGVHWTKLIRDSLREWYYSAKYLDNRTIVIVGSINDGDGVILRTTDEGEHFESHNLTEPLYDVAFTGSQKGIAVGRQGTVTRTTDGGLSWTEPSSITSNKLYGVTLLDSMTFYAVGTGGIVCHSTNGGVDWQQQVWGGVKDLMDITFMDRDTGLVVGEDIILRTTDQGSTWTSITKQSDGNPIPNLGSVVFIDNRVGFAVGELGKILQSTNCGKSWLEIAQPVYKMLNSVTYVPIGNGGVLYVSGWGGTILCSAVSPLNPKTWTWTGLYDSSWHNPNNWSPVGTPLPGDSVIITSAVHSPIIDSVQQQIVIASLNILSGGKLTITDALPRFVVLADVTVYGTLEIRPPAVTTIIVGGNWTIQPGGSEERFAYLSKINSNPQSNEGFIPYHSTVLFSGSGTMAGNFYNIMFDTTSSMRSSGNILLQNQCTMVGDVSLRRNDTVFVTASFPQALVGPGKFLRGTIRRNIEPSALEPYNFESQSSFIKFDGSGTYPSSITITTFSDTAPSNFGDQWTVIPSRVDTATNTIIADSIKEFSKWVFGIPRPRVISDTSSIVKRVYEIDAEGGSEFNCELSLYYDQSEVPIGLPEDSLQLIRLEGSVNVKRNVDMLPKESLLGQNYPNPFNPSTTIRYELPIASHVTLKVYNVLGQEVATLVNEKREAGRYEVKFDGSNLPNSIYFYRLKSKEFTGVRKLLLVK